MKSEINMSETKSFYINTTLILLLAVGLLYGLIFYSVLKDEQSIPARVDLATRCELTGGMLIEGASQLSDGASSDFQICIPETFFEPVPLSDDYVIDPTYNGSYLEY
jgi:hypothetical protein